MNALELADIFDKDGDGCTCFAYSACECACDAVWGESYYKEAASELRRLYEQNKALLEAAKQVIAWYEAEDDHSKADFYQRLEMCRASESALRAAIAAVEGKA